MCVCVAVPVPVLALMHGLIVNDMYEKTHSYHMLVYILCKQTNTLRSFVRSFIHSFTTFIRAQNKQNQTISHNKFVMCVFIHSFIHIPSHTFAHTHTHIVFHQNQHRHLEVLQIVYSWPINSITRASRKSPIPHKFDVAAQWSTREGLIC